MKIIDSGDERKELIFSTVSYRPITFTIDDILDVSDDRTYRTKYRSDPEKVSKQYEYEPYHIHEHNTLEDIRNKSSFYSIFSEGSEIESWKYILPWGTQWQ